MIECVVESVLHHHHVLFVRRRVCFPVFPGLIVYQHYNAQVFIFFFQKYTSRDCAFVKMIYSIIG